MTLIASTEPFAGMLDKEITLPLPADGTQVGEHITEVIGNQERES